MTRLPFTGGNIVLPAFALQRWRTFEGCTRLVLPIDASLFEWREPMKRKGIRRSSTEQVLARIVWRQIEAMQHLQQRPQSQRWESLLKAAIYVAGGVVIGVALARLLWMQSM